MHQLEPHVYLVAANAFRALVREGCSQSLVVSGESGAGKTETTKKAMHYFAKLAGGTGVEDQVLGVRRARGRREMCADAPGKCVAARYCK